MKTYNGIQYKNITPNAASAGDKILFSDDILLIERITQDIDRTWHLHCVELEEGRKAVFDYYDKEELVHLVVNPAQEKMQSALGAALLPW